MVRDVTVSPHQQGNAISFPDPLNTCLSHPHGHFPAPSTTECMREEAASEPVLLSRKEILDRQNHSKFHWKVLGTGAEQKQQLILLQGLLPCWNFTQPPPFPHYICRLCSFFTHCKRHKKKKPLEWATVLCPFLEQLRSLLQNICTRDFRFTSNFWQIFPSSRPKFKPMSSYLQLSGNPVKRGVWK